VRRELLLMLWYVCRTCDLTAMHAIQQARERVHEHAVRCVALSADGTRALTCGDDGAC
jgi:hypothetical protein